MESSTETPPQPEIDGPDSPTTQRIGNYDDLLTELLSLRERHEAVQSKASEMEQNLDLLQRQRDDALDQVSNLKMAVVDVSIQRDMLRGQVSEFEVYLKEKEDEFARRREEELLRKAEVEKDVEFSRESIKKLDIEIKEAKSENGFLIETLNSLRSVKEPLLKIIDCLEDEMVIETANNDKSNTELGIDNEAMAVREEFMVISKLASDAESKVNEFKEMKMKEKRELENSVVSLTEENRDINSLLRVALVEKEAVEKSLNKLRGNTEQKRAALLQIAERGLLRVGFGFMVGSGNVDQSVDSSGLNSSTATASSTASTKSDSSECEEEVVSLASTVERIMKNLRLEISQLRRSLEESRSDTERLQILTEKQAKEIAENRLYIKDLEDRERILTQNVEELMLEIKETEADVVRWREACELEVEAGKNEIEERDKVVAILKQELEKTKAALDISNSKLNLKEELAVTAMAAQSAAERSLQLADSRAAELRDRIEELMRQLEETDSKQRSHRKVWRICWPWSALKLNSANNTNARFQNVRRMLPEMQTLLH
uniref:Uncharacterized protein n=2 Tax=Rhizophora mucronata TaxID=61149 RepID=A0A2P2J7H3_RHIMU